mmetsp:Transcript_98007/g.245517  ORF Transcript_98007/g.245517 Transcript_98007/m.245517 type:complete len:361 (-) Transcript_98007:362-1444(-)
MAASLSPLGLQSSIATAGRDEEGPLWDTIKQRLYKPEVTHIKRLVGKDMIQQNRAMWEELISLRQIMAEFAQQNDSLWQSKKQHVQLYGAPHRDLLRRQVQLLCADVSSQAELCGQVAEDLVPELKDKALRDFIAGSGSGECSDQLSHGPSTPSTRPPSSCGGVSGCTTPDGGRLPPLPLGRPLRVSELDGVAEGIRQALEAENETLLALIGEQMQRFDAEDARRVQANKAGVASEPSTSDLQQLARKLQDLVVSPSLRSLSFTGAVSPSGSRRMDTGATDSEDLLVPLPIGGGAHVRRLKALIAQRRQSVRVDGQVTIFDAPPQAKVGGSTCKDGSAAVVGTETLLQSRFDPFFGDPFA